MRFNWKSTISTSTTCSIPISPINCWIYSGIITSTWKSSGVDACWSLSSKSHINIYVTGLSCGKRLRISTSHSWHPRSNWELDFLWNQERARGKRSLAFNPRHKKTSQTSSIFSVLNNASRRPFGNMLAKHSNGFAYLLRLVIHAVSEPE